MDQPSDLIPRLLAAKRIAVVGVSDDPHKPSHYVSQYMMNAGYEILPINPNLQTILGKTCYPNLREVPGPIDLVNIFRLPKFIPAIVEDAIAINAAGVWVQLGIRSAEAKQIAQAAGLPYIEDHCIMVEHSRRKS
jgi:hypothetical protein